MRRRAALFAWLAVCATALLSLWLFTRAKPVRAPQPASTSTIVSLTPAITETLFAIGAGPRVIGVSDYCDHPPQVRKLPRLGSALTPNFERIARLRPELIVSDLSVASDKTRLDTLAPTLRLPWLSLSQIVASTRQLGRYTARVEAAEALARRLERRLSVRPPEHGPRVLVVLSAESSSIDPVWFVRPNSIHGAALHAAGARNAVAEDVHTMPRMSLERVIALDPDAIVLLVGDSDGSAALAAWRKLHVLRAVAQNRIGTLRGSDVYSDGPRILDFADRLERELERLGAGQP